jgi:hypothetical protein
MPPGFLALFLFGVTGLVVVTVTPLARKLLPASPQPTSTNSPSSEAARLKQQHDDAKAQEEEQKRVLAERRAFRWVREELLDNKHRIQRAWGGKLEELHDLTSEHWEECEATLLEFENPVPHAKARQAYREIRSIDTDNLTLSEVRSATSAIDEATTSLGAAGLGIPETTP